MSNRPERIQGEQIDAEILELISASYAEAKSLLAEKKDLLDAKEIKELLGEDENNCLLNILLSANPDFLG